VHAPGRGSHAPGCNTHAPGYGSHVSGFGSHVSGFNSHASGYGSHASGFNSHTSGYGSHASGSNSHASGSTSHPPGYDSHAHVWSWLQSTASMSAMRRVFPLAAASVVWAAGGRDGRKRASAASAAPDRSAPTIRIAARDNRPASPSAAGDRCSCRRELD